MEMDSDDENLRKLASGDAIDFATWPLLLSTIISRIAKIANDDFPTPVIPLPKAASSPSEPRMLAPLPSSDPVEPPSTKDESRTSSQETNKENTNPTPAPPLPPEPVQEPGALPPQITALMNEIAATLSTSFSQKPPHTVQRLAELVLAPRQHYRSLPAYLHALDRVVHVTSTADIYPLPPAIPDMSSINDTWTNGAGGSNIASAGLNVGSDEALGGALLTPIPWLQRRSASASPPDEAAATAAEAQAQRQMEGQVRTESTETIEGPNGVGSIETVSVSVNGIPSHGATGLQRGVTQGELLRQEQRAGVVPVSQLARAASSTTITSGPSNGGHPARESGEDGADGEAEGEADAAMAEEVPHARGPEEIGPADTGRPEHIFTTGPVAVEMQGIDVEAAVGRRAEHPEDKETKGEEDAERTRRSSTPKREAAEELRAEGPTKRLKEDSETGTGKEGQDAPELDVEGDIVLTDNSKANEKGVEDPSTASDAQAIEGDKEGDES